MADALVGTASHRRFGRVADGHGLLLSGDSVLENQNQFQRRKQLAAFSASLLFSFSTFASETRETLAEHFVTLLQYDRQFEAFNERCVHDQGSFTPESLVARNPNYFDGLTPKSAQWPDVVAAYSEFRQQVCSRPTKTEYLQALSSSYAKAMTAKQLQESIKFYSSATGQALVEANQLAALASDDVVSEVRSKIAVEQTARLQSKIRALISAK